MSITQWFKKNYRIAIYTSLIIIGIIPFLNPIAIPIEINPETRMYYETIENLPEGSKIIILNWWSAGGWGEIAGGNIATINHAVEKNLKIIFLSFGIESPILIERCLKEIKGGKAALGEYGVDWVNLGYIPGAETALKVAMTPPDGIQKAFPSTDAYGNVLADLSIMAEVNDVTSFDLFVSLGAGPSEIVRQLHTPYGARLMTIDIGVDWVESKMFIDRGQVIAGLASTRGSAEYEILVNIPGLATASVGALSLNHLLIIVILIIGNAQSIYEFLTPEKKGGVK